MAITSLSSTAAQSQLIDELLDDLSAMPTLLHWRKSSGELLYTNATFLRLPARRICSPP